MKRSAINLGFLAICLCVVPLAQADITVNWDWDANSGQPVVDLALNPLDYTPTAATVQLIYSPTNIASEADAVIGDGNAYTPDGTGEVLLDTRVVENPGGYWQHTTVVPSASLPVPGYVYQRVFADDGIGSPAPGTAGKGDYYGNGTIFIAVADGGGPYTVHLWDSSSSGGVGGTGGAGQYVVGVEIIPEPGSMALFGLGALVVFVRRRFSR